MAKTKRQSLRIPHLLSGGLSTTYGAIIAEGARGYLNIWVVITATVVYILGMAAVSGLYESILDRE